MSVAARATVLGIVACGCALSATPGASPDRADPTPPAAAPTPANPPTQPDSLNDGPHVYWQSQGAAIVFYLCDGVVLEQRLATRDTLRFHGFCHDSTWEYVVPAEPPPVAPHTHDDVPRILAVSDIHGEYEALASLLEASGVVDAELHWRWGTGHLVIDGDVFDRGDKVTECLWLLYRLDIEAQVAGGRVHLLLGNHETMVLRRDLRYVSAKYTDGIVRATRINYTDMFGPDMELGRWLRTKHTALRLNDVLFVHGGIPPALAERGTPLAEINALARETLDARSYVVAFDETLRGYYGHSDEGPFWYRGYHGAQEGRYLQATADEVDDILRAYGVGTIVVGHTGVEQIQRLYEGRVIGIDIPLEELGAFHGLLWEDRRFFRVTGDGSREPLEP